MSERLSVRVPNTSKGKKNITVRAEFLHCESPKTIDAPNLWYLSFTPSELNKTKIINLSNR